jgi:hypothetical protein
MNPDRCPAPGSLVLDCRESGICYGGAVPTRHGCSTPWQAAPERTPVFRRSLPQFFARYCVDRSALSLHAGSAINQSAPNNSLHTDQAWSGGRRSRIEHCRHSDSRSIPKTAGQDRMHQYDLVMPRRAGLVDSAPMVEGTCTNPESATRFEAAERDAAKPGKTVQMYALGS